MYSDNWNYATEAVKSDDFSSDFSQVVDSFTEVPRQQLWIPALAGNKYRHRNKRIHKYSSIF